MRWLTPTDKKLWRLAVPMILSNISVPLLGLVDVTVIGHLSSAIFLAGVAIATSVTSFVFMLFLFLRMGTTGMTAQAWGEKDHFKLIQSLLQPLTIAIVAGSLFAFFHQPISHFILQLIPTDAETQYQAQRFLNLRWLSAPATLGNMVILGWLLGVQYAQAPLILLVVGNIANIVLELLLVIHWQYGVAGAALATVMAEYLSLIIGFFLVWRVARKNNLILSGSWALLSRGASRLLRLNSDILLRSLLLQLCLAMFTIIGSHLGANIVAVNAILMMFLTFTAYALDGFAYAVESVSGEAFGARNPQALTSIWQAACKQAGLVALIFCLSYACAGKTIIHLLTSLPDLRNQSYHYFAWQIVCPLVGVWCYLLDGLFVGATRGREMRNSMAIAALGFGLTLLTVPIIGNHGLWLAFIVFLALRGITLGYSWRKHRQHHTWFTIN